MSDEIISALIIATSTFLSTGILGLAGILITNKMSKIKENNQKLADDWEFLYKVEEILLLELEERTGIPSRTKKIECRKLITEKLNRGLQIEGLSKLNKLKN